MKDVYLKKNKIFSKSFFLVIIITILVGLAGSKVYADKVQKKISDSIIRFHVVANSDLEDDQELKLKVRDGVIKYLSDNITGIYNKNEYRDILNSHINSIREVSQSIVLENGYGYKVDVELSSEIFPKRSYGEARLPSGEYEALKITIGDGKGHNWWCVAYPPLCFIDITKGDVTNESAKRLSIETGEEIVIVSDDIVPEFKFKIVELWKDFENRRVDFAVKP